MSFQTDICNAVAQVIISAGVGVYWRENMTTPVNDKFALALIRTPKTPDRVMVLTSSITNEALTLDDDDNSCRVGLQIRIRGDKSTQTARDAADELTELLHGLTQVPAGNATILIMTQENSVSAGEEANSGRYAWIVNYSLVVERG